MAGAPGLAWLEGIRTDPAVRGRGVGRALTEALVDGARAADASRIALSTHIDNQASIHIVEAYGFRRAASFIYHERPADVAAQGGRGDATRIVDVAEAETIRFVAGSSFLELAHGRFPRGWRFFPFDHDPGEAVARLATRLGWIDRGRLSALLCIRQPPGCSGEATLNFLDGELGAMEALLQRALPLYPKTGIAAMVPCSRGRTAAAGPLLAAAGFRTWTDGAPDVFLYEWADP